MEPVPFTQADVDGSIPARFARVAASAPTRLAIVAGAERLTYGELDQRSSRLAAAIVREARGHAAPVAVLAAEPSAAIVGMLATWKAGKLCLPLDPAAVPPARLQVVLRDAEAGLVVTDRGGSAAIEGLALAGSSARELRLDAVDLRAPGEAIQADVGADTLACLLYTSGSTGEPKGLVRSHRNVLHRARCAVASLAIQPADRVSALHSPSFAAGLRDVMTALLAGATLLPFDLRRAGLGALAGWIEREEISVLCAVVTTFRHLLASLGPRERFASVRVVRLGSEPLYRQDVERFRSHFSAECVLVAGYGASEASGIVEYRMHHDTPLPAGRVPAGYPLEGVELQVLDDEGRTVGPDQSGEVAVRSRYLSEGYWRRPDLTQATFRPDPIDPATRIYRTGDIGRLRPDGCLELLGRRDQQVKVRGYRVHPGEIELALAEHPAIREAVVTAPAGEDGEPRLVAYVVPAAGPGPSAGALRRFLRARLPAYMVPAEFVSLESLPVNASGKVDRAALPPPPARPPARGAALVPLGSPLEYQIALIWEELFDVSPIGADDDFFDLGGDSLLAAGFVAAMEDATGRALSPSVLLEASTVAGLASLLVHEPGAFDQPVTTLRASGALTPLFFLHGDHHGGGFYCHALARHLDPDRPFHAVHPHGLDRRPPPPTVEAMAADRLAAVRAIRPHGPYLLGGYCNGGLVALEMARRLQAEGERVEVVVLVEARAPGPGIRALHRAADTLGRLIGLPVGARARLFAGLERVSDEMVATPRYYSARARLLARSGLRGQAAFLRRRLWGRATDGDDEAPRRARHHHPGFHRVIRRYIPRPYAGRAALLRVEDATERRPELDWSRVLPRLEVVSLPGDHPTCITRHVAVFAARLEETLKGAEAGVRARS